MKVLFVCHYNVGRSQMAKAIFNQLTNSSDADAAGTDVKEVGQNLEERKNTTTSHNFFVLDVMNEIGIDMSQATRNQLTKDMIDKYDYVISMAKKEHSPDWLTNAPNLIYWDIKDPKGQNFEITTKARDEIKAKVLELIDKK